MCLSRPVVSGALYPCSLSAQFVSHAPRRFAWFSPKALFLSRDPAPGPPCPGLSHLLRLLLDVAVSRASWSLTTWPVPRSTGQACCRMRRCRACPAFSSWSRWGGGSRGGAPSRKAPSSPPAGERCWPGVSRLRKRGLASSRESRAFPRVLLPGGDTGAASLRRGACAPGLPRGIRTLLAVLCMGLGLSSLKFTVTPGSSEKESRIDCVMIG